MAELDRCVLRLPAYVCKGICSGRLASIQHYLLDKEDFIDISYTKHFINKNTPEFSLCTTEKHLHLHIQDSF